MSLTLDDMQAACGQGRTFTQKEIADATGMSRSMVFKIEQAALRKITEGLADDPYVREWCEENGIDIEPRSGGKGE